MTFTSNAEATATTFSNTAIISNTTSALSSTLASQTSSTTPSITASTVPALSHHKSKGLVAGAIAVGVITSVAIIVLLFLMLYRRRAKQQATAAAQNASRATDWAEYKEVASSIRSSTSAKHELGDDPNKRHELEEGTVNHELNALAPGDRLAGDDALHELPAEVLQVTSSVPGEGDAAGSVLEEGEAASTVPEHSKEGG
jgi:flagellar biosynthesis/type III secretory pathway M-ring protein FliF/YscJ